MANTSRIGGFVAVNTGSITDCYSAVSFNAKKAVSGGFVGENKGSIQTSFSISSLSGLRGGFTGLGNEGSDSCYFLHNEKQGSKRLERLWDRANGQRLSEITDEAGARALGFDLDNVWKYQDKSTPFRFIEDKWLYHTAMSASAITIGSAEELFQFAEKVNSGDAEAKNAEVSLTADLDLGGKEWIPIGCSRTNPFGGIFDGGGFTVKNFVIKDKKYDNKGFFGFLKGKVYNLTVDCVINGSACCGALVAQNNGGTVGCCGALVRIKGRKGITLGGLVGKNSGDVFMSYVVGRFPFVILPVWPVFILVGVVLLYASVPYIKTILPTTEKEPTPIFHPVPYDPEAVLDPEGTDQPSTAEDNFVSFQFEHEIAISRESGLCAFNFKNPAASNHSIVVQLQFTDSQAVTVMGSTGRTPEEQAEAEALPGYDADTYRTVIAESGAIPPGYRLDNLRLVTHANGATIPPGTYNAVVYLIFYDIETNNRAMLESQLPVIITVQ